MSKSLEQLYALKVLAAEHMKGFRYPQAVVYFKDILAKFQREVAEITSQREMERAIRELQLASQKNLSLCYLKLKKHQQCVEECKSVLEIQPNNLKIIYRVGRALLELKEYDRAEQYLKRGFYLDSHEKEIMKALEQIEDNRHKTVVVQTSTAQESSIFIDIIKYLLTILFAMVTFPLRSLRSIKKYVFPHKQEEARHFD